MPESIAENRSNGFVFAVVVVVVLAVLTLTCGSTTSPLPCAGSAAVVAAASCVLAARRMLAVLSPWFYVGGGPVIRRGHEWSPPFYMYARACDDDLSGVALTLGAAALLLALALLFLPRRRSVGLKKVDKVEGKSE
uniref:Uncharacterized protein n=1 Tax=Oryza nivara TaxID=4536 RepID=A0A0E0IS23_ORYNI